MVDLRFGAVAGRRSGRGLQLGDDGLDDVEVAGAAGDDEAVGALIDGDAQIGQWDAARRPLDGQPDRPARAARHASRRPAGRRRRPPGVAAAPGPPPAAPVSWPGPWPAGRRRSCPGRAAHQVAIVARRCFLSVTTLTTYWAAGATSSESMQRLQQLLRLRRGEDHQAVGVLVRQDEHVLQQPDWAMTLPVFGSVNRW